MTATEHIWIAGGRLSLDKWPIECSGKCVFCGQAVDCGLRLKDAVSDNFNNWDLLSFNRSGEQMVCIPCAWCLSERKLRVRNFIATESGIIYFSRKELAVNLFEVPYDPPLAICITRSYKKHNAIRAVLSGDDRIWRIREEDRIYDFDRFFWRPVFELLCEAYRIFSKAELQSGHYHSSRLLKYGAERFASLEGTFAPLRGNPSFELLIYALNKDEEEDNGSGKTDNQG